MLLGWRKRRRGELLVLLVGLGPLGAGRTRHDRRRVAVLPDVLVVVAGSESVGAGVGVVGQVRFLVYLGLGWVGLAGVRWARRPCWPVLVVSAGVMNYAE